MTSPSSTALGFLTHVVVTHLSPMFRATTGNHDQANNAALEAVKACLTGNPADLFLIGQMIALGLGALSSVSRSMSEDLPINLVLRLRGNAVNMSRASQQCRRALPDPDPAVRCPDAPVAAPVEAPAIEPSTLAVADKTNDPGLPPLFPASFDTMKAAIARMLSGPEEAAKLKSMSANPGKILPAGSTDMVGKLLSQPRAEPPTSLRAVVLGTTTNHLISGAQRPRLSLGSPT